MDPTATDATEQQIPAFRPGKKRKIYRHRAEDADESPLDAPLPAAHSTSPSELKAPGDATSAADTDEHIPVSSLLRLRQSRKSRLGGVAFRAGSTRGDETPQDTEQTLVPHEGAVENPIVGGITKRFAPQTGLAGELVNKHMEEYIESELAKRHAAEANAAAVAHGTAAAQPTAQAIASSTNVQGKPVVESATQGKLMEIDLGDEVKARNVAMTERARRRALGEAVDEHEDSGASSSRPRKVRLGRDGKPWRGRNRRNSEDIKRDQLVEEFLKENSLGVYDLPPEPSPAAGGNMDDEGADDKIAEEFRREFMDAMMQRQQRKRPASNAKPPAKGAKAAEEVLKGPKLGGSRNQRAAMRDLLLREQEKKR